jgi:hypothetical protein
MGASTSNLQYLFEFQMQQNNEEKKSHNPKLWYLVWFFLKKKLLTSLVSNLIIFHFKFILSELESYGCAN